jgi:multicomponent K+:H+ antiporter subunit D
VTGAGLAWSDHLVVAPILLPLATGAAMLVVGDARRRVNATLNAVATVAGLGIAIALLLRVDGMGAGGADAFAVYLPGNWPVPFGIALVADRLSAGMVVLASTLGVAALVFALARWQEAGVYFHALFQLQLAGLHGAFLTADLFNLFVFFEVLLAASYALLLHGGGIERVKAGLHYIAINLMASLLFLIGVAVLYGVTGTLNMADIAVKLRSVPVDDRGLLHAGAAILAVAFLAKAAVWPLNCWLPSAYAAASAPAAAVFAILTKVGVYALLRLWTLCFPADAGASAGFGGPVLVWGGIATLGFGAIGMLASQHLDRFAGYSIVASSGTLLAAIGFDAPALSAGALLYLASSTLAGSALLLLVELLERARRVEIGPIDTDHVHDDLPAFSTVAAARQPAPRKVLRNVDETADDDDAPVGRAIPRSLAFLGVGFTVCGLVVAGLPPLSGFVAKLAMLRPLVEVGTPAAWTLFAGLLVSGLFAATALVRIGIRHFWTVGDRPAPRLRLAEALPIGLLLGALVVLVVQAEPALRYARATADALHEPARYVAAVKGRSPVERAPAAGAEGPR